MVVPVTVEDLWDTIFVGADETPKTIADYQIERDLVIPQLSDGLLQVFFDVHDLNDDGQVEKAELDQARATEDLKETIELTKDAIMTIDENNNMVISEVEFAQFYDNLKTLDIVTEIDAAQLTQFYDDLAIAFGNGTEIANSDLFDVIKAGFQAGFDVITDASLA